MDPIWFQVFSPMPGKTSDRHGVAVVDRDLLVTEFTMLRPNPVFEWSNITVVVDTGDSLDRQIGPSPLPHLPPLSYGLALDFKAGWWHWDDFTKNANELYMQTLVKCEQ